MTTKLYYESAYMIGFDAEVLSCTEKGKEFLIELDRTAFYPEGGGQPADRGVLVYSDGAAKECSIKVRDVHEKEDVILHTCDRAVEPGTKVHGTIDWQRRFDHMQQHSGEHIVSGMICSAFHCDNVGFHMGEKIVTIDYNAFMTWEDILEIEKKANAYIWEAHDFVEMWPDAEELKALDYRSKKELTGAVRITSFPGADMCACCGTHVKNSAEVGLVKFLSIQKFHDGVRIELVSGSRAVDVLSMDFAQNRAIAKALSAKENESFRIFKKQQEEAFQVRVQLSQMEEKYFGLLAAAYEGKGDVLLIEGPMSADSVRKLTLMIAKCCGGRAAVFAGEEGSYKYAVTHEGQDISAMVKEMNQVLSGRGGGRDGFAQGSAACREAQIRAYFSGSC